MRANHANDATPRNASPKRVLVSLWMNGVFGGDVVDGIHEELRDSGAIWRIRFDGRLAGRLAVRALAAMMDGRPAPRPEALRYSCTPIAKRGSTAATPSIGEIVQKALDYIDANACAGATLDDVVRHCCYSRI